MVKHLAITFVLLLTTLAAFAQGGHVKGTVKDSAGEPVIGATVTEVGNNKRLERKLHALDLAEGKTNPGELCRHEAADREGSLSG